MLKKFLALSLTCVLMLSSSVSEAKEKRASFEKVINRVELKHERNTSAEAAKKWKPAEKGGDIYLGDILRTGLNSATEIKYDDGTVTRIGSRTVMTIDDRKITLNKGYFWGKVDKKLTKGLKIFTASVVAAITGTEFFVEVDGDQNTIITVLDGEIEVASKYGKFFVTPGTYIVVSKNGDIKMPTSFRQEDVLARYNEVVKM